MEIKTEENNKDKGGRGESIAADFLKGLGYEIIKRNFRFGREAEIDIIAKDKGTLVFIEVKTRSSEFCGSPFEAITKTKYEHIKTGLYSYLQEEKVKYKKFRIDAISVVLRPEIKIKHLKNI